MNDSPSPTAGNGRASNGRFLPGNKIARGNPLNRRVQQIRAALLGAVTRADARKIARALLDKAASGDLPAIREFYDRAIGRPTQGDVAERLADLETRLDDLLNERMHR